jgi:hypothetical protein
MTTSITEHTIGGLRWVVVAGPRLEAFHALGQLARGEIRGVLDGLPERHDLERFAATPQGRTALDRVAVATATAHPTEYGELQALATGAGVDFDTMLLLNLRGDLGADDGTGCSDLGWQRERSFIAHNEDGAPALQGRFMLVALAVDGDVPLTVQWYAGFLPSNTFAVTGHGLVWGIDHVQVGTPAAAPGRHFIARGLQQARSLDAALRYLSTHPSAGGFAYTIGELASRRVVTVEAAAGRVAIVEADPLLWHTNHLRYLDGGVDGGGKSLARGRLLDSVALPATEPTPDWFLDLLTSPGVYRNAHDGDPLMTLCSTAVDLTTAEVTLQPRDGPRVTLPLADLADAPATPPPRASRPRDP